MGPTDGAERGGAGRKARPGPRSPRSISRTTRGSDEREGSGGERGDSVRQEMEDQLGDRKSSGRAVTSGAARVSRNSGFGVFRDGAVDRPARSPRGPLRVRAATSRTRGDAFVRPLPRARRLSARAALRVASARGRSTATRRVERECASPEPRGCGRPRGPPRPPRSRVLETSDASRRRGAFASAAAAAFGAAALAAPLAAPPSSPRPRTPRPPRPPRVAGGPGGPREKINPNLIQLPEPVREKIDQGMMKLGDAVGLATIVQMQAQDPWSVEDGSSSWRWLIGAADGKLDALHPPVDGEAEDARDAGSTRRCGRGSGPMKAINTVWIVLYVHDNVSRMFLRAAFGGYRVQPTSACTSSAAARWPSWPSCDSPGCYTPASASPRARARPFSPPRDDPRRRRVGVEGGFVVQRPRVEHDRRRRRRRVDVRLAARGRPPNVMGGMMIAILRPFTVGEEIFVTPGNNFRGSNSRP